MAMDRNQRRMTAPEVSTLGKTGPNHHQQSNAHKRGPQRAIHLSSRSLSLHPRQGNARFGPNSPETGSHHLSPSSFPGPKANLSPQSTCASPVRRRRIFGHRTRSASPRTLSPARRQLPTTPLHRRPSTRLEATLRKFTDFALPFHLDMINQHKQNIQRLQAEGDWNKVRHEVDLVSRGVHQLGSLIFEMEILRSYLEAAELPHFDARVIPAKTSALVAIHGLQEMCPGHPTGNYSHFAQRKLSMGGFRSNSLTDRTRSPDSPLDSPHFHGARRHSDSDTQSCHSLPTSLSEDLRDPVLKSDQVQKNMNTTSIGQFGSGRLKTMSSYVVPCHAPNYENAQVHQSHPPPGEFPNLLLSDCSMHEGSHPARPANLDQSGTASFPGSGGRAPSGLVGGPTGSSKTSLSTSPQQGGGTLEVLYEDPKEDSISILSSEDGTFTLERRRQSIPNHASDPASSSSPSSKGPNQLRTIPHIYRQQGQSSLMVADQWSGTNDLDRRKDTLQSWHRLEEEIRDFQMLIAEFSNVSVSDKTPDPSGSLQNVKRSCRVRTSHISSSAIYPVAGALIGTCLGGPVGLLAGVKIGGLAAIGGSVFGYTTGNVIKEHKDRQEYIDDFYACHPHASRPLARTSSLRHHEDAKRAQSLPDVLNEDEDGLMTTDSSPLLARRRSNSTRRPKPSSLSANPSQSPSKPAVSTSVSYMGGGSQPNVAMLALMRSKSAQRSAARSVDNIGGD